MRERRRDQKRQRRRITVRFRPLGSDKEFRSGFSDDVSPSGLFVQTAFSVAPGREVELLVEVPGGPRRLLGRVAWARRAPTGLTGRKRSGMGIRLHPGQPGLDGLEGKPDGMTAQDRPRR